MIEPCFLAQTVHVGHEFMKIGWQTMARGMLVIVPVRRKAAPPPPCPLRTTRATDWTKVSSTVCRSKFERLITWSTSAVAVCCWEPIPAAR